MKTTLTIEYWRDGHWHVGQLREVPGVFSQGGISPSCMRTCAMPTGWC